MQGDRRDHGGHQRGDDRRAPPQVRPGRPEHRGRGRQRHQEVGLQGGLHAGVEDRGHQRVGRQVAPGQALEPGVEHGESDHEHDADGGDREQPDPGAAAVGDGRVEQQRDRRGQRLGPDRGAPEADRRGHREQRRRVALQRPAAERQAQEHPRHRGHVRHERGVQQAEARPQRQHQRGDARVALAERGPQQVVHAHQPDQAEHQHVDLLGGDARGQRAEQDELPDQRRPVPAEQGDVAGAGEVLRDPAVGPAVVVRDGEAAGGRGHDQRHEHAGHERHQQPAVPAEEGEQGVQAQPARAGARSVRLRRARVRSVHFRVDAAGSCNRLGHPSPPQGSIFRTRPYLTLAPSVCHRDEGLPCQDPRTSVRYRSITERRRAGHPPAGAAVPRTRIPTTSSG